MACWSRREGQMWPMHRTQPRGMRREYPDGWTESFLPLGNAAAVAIVK